MSNARMSAEENVEGQEQEDEVESMGDGRISGADKAFRRRGS